MAAGYMMMGVHHITALYVAMTLVILGNGFFKPNISTLLGNIYNTPDFKHRKDEGYNIFYMGINIGAFICNFFGAALQILLGWEWAFFAAGVGMLIGVMVFLMGSRHYEGYIEPKGTQPGDMPMSKILMLILLPSVAFGVMGWLINGIEGPGNPNASIFGSDSTDAFIFACIPVVYFYAQLYFKAKVEERRQIGALLTIFAVVIMFWAVFKLNGSALNTWANNYTDRSVTGTAETITSGIKLSKELRYEKVLTDSLDAQFRPVKVDGKKVQSDSYPIYFKNQAKEKLPAEGSTISLWATNLSQSINPAWVIMLTPLVVALFSFLRLRNREPSTPAKIALGLLISGLSVLVMVGAVMAGNNGAEKVSVWWLICNYGVITIGELFLSPMGLSLVSKLSPSGITSLMMGGWFLSTSIGNKLSGVLASMWDQYDNKANFFWVNFILLTLAALLMFSLLRRLNAVMKEQGIH